MSVSLSIDQEGHEPLAGDREGPAHGRPTSILEVPGTDGRLDVPSWDRGRGLRVHLDQEDRHLGVAATVDLIVMVGGRPARGLLEAVDQLARFDPQPVGEAEQGGQSWLASAALQAPDRGRVDVGLARQPVLGHPDPRPDLSQPFAERGAGCLGVFVEGPVRHRRERVGSRPIGPERIGRERDGTERFGRVRSDAQGHSIGR